MRRCASVGVLALATGCGGITVGAAGGDAAVDARSGDTAAEAGADAHGDVSAESSADAPVPSDECVWTLADSKQLTAFDHPIQFGNAIELAAGASGTRDVLIAETCAASGCTDPTWSAQQIDALGVTTDAFTLLVDKPATGATSNAFLGTPAGGVAVAWDEVHGCRAVALRPDQRPSGPARTLARDPCFSAVAEPDRVSALSMPRAGAGPLSLVVLSAAGVATTGPRLDLDSVGIGGVATERVAGEPFVVAFTATKPGAQAIYAVRATSDGAVAIAPHAVAPLGAPTALVQLASTDDGGSLVVWREPVASGSRIFALRLSADLNAVGAPETLVDSASDDIGFSVARSNASGMRGDILVAYVDSLAGDAIAHGHLQVVVLDGLGARRAALQQRTAFAASHLQLVATPRGAIAVWEGMAGANRQIFATPLVCLAPSK